MPSRRERDRRRRRQQKERALAAAAANAATAASPTSKGPHRPTPITIPPVPTHEAAGAAAASGLAVPTIDVEDQVAGILDDTLEKLQPVPAQVHAAMWAVLRLDIRFEATLKRYRRMARRHDRALQQLYGGPHPARSPVPLLPWADDAVEETPASPPVSPSVPIKNRKRKAAQIAAAAAAAIAAAHAQAKKQAQDKKGKEKDGSGSDSDDTDSDDSDSDMGVAPEGPDGVSRIDTLFPELQEDAFSTSFDAPSSDEEYIYSSGDDLDDYDVDAVESRLDALRDDLARVAEEKINTSIRGYEALDAHIRALDARLKPVETSMRATFRSVPAGNVDLKWGTPLAVDHDPETLEYQLLLQTELQREIQRQHSLDLQSLQSRGAAARGSARKPANSRNTDPNEPLYCLCKRVSFGEMVACDANDCEYDWFHFHCVGLETKPQGAWYCPECALKRVVGTATEEMIKAAEAARAFAKRSHEEWELRMGLRQRPPPLVPAKRSHKPKLKPAAQRALRREKERVRRERQRQARARKSERDRKRKEQRRREADKKRRR